MTGSARAAARPLVVGLTGSIGMGKSTVAAMFADLGVPVFDADAEVRRMQGPHGQLLAPIEAAFPGTTGEDGVDRAALGMKVFDDRDAMARLESIVHPAVREARARFLEANAHSPLVLYDIPLLFETGGSELVDRIVVVSAPAEIQRERVLARDGMTAEKFESILDLQLPDVAKRARADFVIDTGTSLAETREAVEELVEKLRAEGEHGLQDD